MPHSKPSTATCEAFSRSPGECPVVLTTKSAPSDPRIQPRRRCRYEDAALGLAHTGVVALVPTAAGSPGGWAGGRRPTPPSVVRSRSATWPRSRLALAVQRPDYGEREPAIIPDMDNQLVVHNDKNVYVLGAGFSTAARIPVIRDFLDRMRDASKWLKSEGRTEELLAIESVLRFRQDASPAGYRMAIDLDNIEDLFSLAAALPSEGVTKEIPLAIAATLDFAEKAARPVPITLRVKPPWPKNWMLGWNPNADTKGGDDVVCSAVDYMASVMSGSASKTLPEDNCVITFNYDLVLEEALERLEIEFKYFLTGDGVEYHQSTRCNRNVAPAALRVFKLHGSVNWAEHPDQKNHVFGRYQDGLKIGLRPHLIPPTWNKSLSSATRQVWDAALDSLREATRIVIIGFSMPPTDQHFKHLLAAGLKDNNSLREIVFVNPSAHELRLQLERVLRRDQFEAGVVRLAPTTAAEFLTDPAELTQIGRPFRHDGCSSFGTEERTFLPGDSSTPTLFNTRKVHDS